MDLTDVPTMDLRAELTSRNAEHGNTTFVVRGRGGGKTTAAVAWVLSNPNSKLLVSTVQRKRDIESAGEDVCGIQGHDGGYERDDWVRDRDADIDLIAHARQDIPDLIAEVERLSNCADNDDLTHSCCTLVETLDSELVQEINALKSEVATLRAVIHAAGIHDTRCDVVERPTGFGPFRCPHPMPCPIHYEPYEAK